MARGMINWEMLTSSHLQPWPEDTKNSAQIGIGDMHPHPFTMTRGCSVGSLRTEPLV